MEFIFFVVGVVFGVVVTRMFYLSKIANGILKVRHDEGEPYLFLELTQEDMNNIHKKDCVVLKVDITQE